MSARTEVYLALIDDGMLSQSIVVVNQSHTRSTVQDAIRAVAEYCVVLFSIPYRSSPACSPLPMISRVSIRFSAAAIRLNGAKYAESQAMEHVREHDKWHRSSCPSLSCSDHAINSKI